MGLVHRLRNADTPHQYIPEPEELFSIRRADTLEYQLSPKEVQKTRRKIYKINKNDPRGRRFRTMLEIDILKVWRVA